LIDLRLILITRFSGKETLILLAIDLPLFKTSQKGKKLIVWGLLGSLDILSSKLRFKKLEFNGWLYCRGPNLMPQDQVLAAFFPLLGINGRISF